MSKHAIKTGRYTHELRSRNILEVKRLQNQKCKEQMEVEDTKPKVLNVGPSCVTFGETESVTQREGIKPEIKGTFMTNMYVKRLSKLAHEHITSTTLSDRNF